MVGFFKENFTVFASSSISPRYQRISAAVRFESDGTLFNSPAVPGMLGPLTQWSLTVSPTYTSLGPEIVKLSGLAGK